MKVIDPQLLQSGDSAAVRQWFVEYHDQLLKFVLQKVSVSADAEEIVQETFINCLRQIALFRGDSSIWTWMCSIARHEIADYYRKKYAKKALQYLPLFEVALAEKQVSQSLALAQSDLVARVHVVLLQLPEREQELLLLKYVDQKSVHEIARLFGKTVQAIESLLYRARQMFRQEWLANSVLEQEIT